MSYNGIQKLDHALRWIDHTPTLTCGGTVRCRTNAVLTAPGSSFRSHSLPLPARRPSANWPENTRFIPTRSASGNASDSRAAIRSSKTATPATSGIRARSSPPACSPPRWRRPAPGSAWMGVGASSTTSSSNGSGGRSSTRMSTSKTTQPSPNWIRVYSAIFRSTTTKGRIRVWATASRHRCISGILDVSTIRERCKSLSREARG